MSTGVSGTLVTRKYGNFRGVDFSNRKDEVSYVRLPDALNVWKNYKNNTGKAIETRPGIDLVKEFTETIFGLYFFNYNGETHRIVHDKNKLYDNDNVIYSNMAEHKSQAFIYNSKLYIKDGTSYMVYDGESLSTVVGYVPTTTMSKTPNGGGATYEDVNLLTGVRKNSFVSDGVSTEYFVDSESFDADYPVKVWVNGKELTSGFTVDASVGKITFTTAPSEPDTVGRDNVVIQFKKTIEGYRDKIDKCTLVEIFDNRVFFAGNPDYPNMLWHCSLEDPTYCSDLDYYTEGNDDSKIMALISGNNALWVATSNSTYYHTPTIDDTLGKVYPSTHSSIHLGCVSTGINFLDDITFFSERGLEGISSDVTTEQFASHRSSLVDSRLLNESEYKNLIIEEYQGYLLVATGNNIYLADSRSKTTINDHWEYEWWFWSFDKKITGLKVHNEVLYIVMDKEIYSLTNDSENREVEAHFTTKDDEFNYPQYQKTSNKKGAVIDIEGNNISVYAKVDNGNYELINQYKETKGYIVPRIKKKKWKSISLKFYSTQPFELYSATLEAYIGSYMKRG